MTGFGEARHEGNSYSLLVELRAVNNRFLKVAVRGPDPYPMLEAEVEKIVRRTVKRGTLTAQVRIDRLDARCEHRLNEQVLLSYFRQVETVFNRANLSQYVPAILPSLLRLPGVAEDGPMQGHPSEEEWKVFETVLTEAVGRLQQMRLEEGLAMAAELKRLEALLGCNLLKIRERVPEVVLAFRTRLRERIAAALRAESVPFSEENLLREVALFADRCDINEEIARLDSHLAQFRDIVDRESDSPGRKLEFVVQEMAREANTIGSKASDAAISRLVVEIKSTLEKIRELIQNIE